MSDVVSLRDVLWTIALSLLLSGMLPREGRLVLGVLLAGALTYFAPN